MLNTLRIKSIWGARLPRLAAALLLAASGAAMAADVSFGLWAKSASTTLPGPSVVTVWGYADSASAPVTKPGGPVLIVNQGDNVTVTLTNSLAAPSGLLFQGQSMVPDTAGAAAGGTNTYTFTASNPGTFLYEAALLPGAQYQAAMGLYGALIVRPTAVPPRTDIGTTVVNASTVVADTAALATDLGSAVSGTGIPAGASITAVTAGVSFTMSAAATADGDGTVTVTRVAAYADAATAYNDEAVLVLSEIDPALNGNANPAAFDMRNYAPQYFLINGKAYPDTDPIAGAPGHRVVLRYVNAGIKHHSMAVLGLRQNFVAKDGGLLPTLSHNVASETLGPGQTADAIATVPATVATSSKFAVYDAGLMLRNSSAAGFGGMLTFVNAGTGAAVTGPTTSAVALTPNRSNGSAAVALSATIAKPGSTVTAAEYFIDTPGTAGTGTAMSGTFGGASAAVNATLSPAQLALLSAGNHTFFVHGTDGTTWGGFGSATLNLDKAGPATTNPTLTPNPSNGTVAVALHATGNDTATGGSNIAAAEYFIGTPGANGAGTAMTVNAATPIASLDKIIAAPVTGGVISVHSMDALGNWGPFTTITLSVVAAGPVTTAVTATPNPNNGARPLNSSQPVVRISANVASTGSTVAGAEGFIDAVGAPGSGFPFVPQDGLWNGASEVGNADIPLGTINTLSNGNHTIYVRGRDAAGNWGSPTATTATWPAAATVILTIDKTAPTVGVTPAVNTVAFGGSVTLTVAAADVGVGVTARQYWIDGSATPPANPTAFTGTSINLTGLSAGTHVVYVRVQDGASNWSAVSSVTVYVMQAVADARPPITANGNATQNSDANAAAGVLANDQPLGLTGRTARLFSAPVRTLGAGAGTITVTCQGGGNTAATPAIGGNTVCTNGAYRVTLNGVGANNAQRQASKRGTYTFTYTEILNGATSNATVTITVN